MRIRRAAAAAWALWLLSMAGIGLGLSLGTRTSSDLVELLPLLSAFVAYATVGAIVAGRRPRNPIGWLFLAIGILTAGASIGEPYAIQSFGARGEVPASAVLAAWTQQWFCIRSLPWPPCLPCFCSPPGSPPAGGARCCG